MRVGDRDDAAILLWILQLFQDIVSQAGVVQLSVSANASQGESPHLTLNLAVKRTVAVILRTSGGEVDNVISMVDLVREVA